MSSKDRQIQLLESEIIRLKKTMNLSIPFNKISAELVAAFPEVSQIGYAARIQTDFTSQDTLPVFEIKYIPSLSSTSKATLSPRIENWLKTRLVLDTLVVREN